MAGLPTPAMTRSSVVHSHNVQIILLLDCSSRAKDAMDFQFCQKNSYIILELEETS